MARRKPKKEVVVFAWTDDTLYVRLDAVMPFLVALCDGLSFTFFDKNRKVPYLVVTDAIEWCQSEITNHFNSSKGMKERLDVLRGAQAGFDHEKRNGFPNGDKFKLRDPDEALPPKEISPP